MATLDISKIKVTRVPLTEIAYDKNENIRDPLSKEQYDVEAMIPDLQARGQLIPVLLYQGDDGKKHILRGFLRTGAMLAASAQGLHFSDEAMNCAGQRMDFVLAQVVTVPLTPIQKADLKYDHSQTRGLDIVGLQRAIEECLAAGMTEEATVARSETLLRQYYPMRRGVAKIDPNVPNDDKRYRKELLNYYKGVIQTIKKVYESPTVLRNMWFSKLRGGPPVPTVGDLTKLWQVYRNELKTDVSSRLNQDNPGPVFLQAWEAYLTSLIEGARKGGKDKPTPILERTTMEARATQGRSRIVKLAYRYALNQLSQETFVEFDAAVAAVECGITGAVDVLNSVLDRITGTSVTPPTEAPTDDTPAVSDPPKTDSDNVTDAA